MLTFTMGNRTVQFTEAGSSTPWKRHGKHLPKIELRELGSAEPYPFMPPVSRPEPAARPVTRPAKATKPAPVAIPAPATAKEDTMPRTTTSEKTDKINAALKALNLQPLTEAQALELLKANAMSPKRVIRTFRESKALTTEQAIAAAPKADAANDTPSPAAALAKAISEHPAAAGLPPGKLLVGVVGGKSKAKAKQAAA